MFIPTPLSLYKPTTEPHKHAHKTTSLCTGLKTSHPFYVDRSTSRLFHCSIHSFPKQRTAVTTWRLKENVLRVFGFTTTSWFQRTWGGQNKNQLVEWITFEKRSKGLLSHFKNKGVILPLHLNLKHLKKKKKKKRHLRTLSGHKIEFRHCPLTMMDHVSSCFHN